MSSGSASGGSYVDYGNNQSYVEWSINVANAGQYLISFRYALDSSPRPLSLTVNGELQSKQAANADIPIVYYGGSPTEQYPLERCAGDCDNDDQCAHGYEIRI